MRLVSVAGAGMVRGDEELNSAESDEAAEDVGREVFGVPTLSETCAALMMSAAYTHIELSVSSSKVAFSWFSPFQQRHTRLPVNALLAKEA